MSIFSGGRPECGKWAANVRHCKATCVMQLLSWTCSHEVIDGEKQSRRLLTDMDQARRLSLLIPTESLAFILSCVLAPSASAGSTSLAAPALRLKLLYLWMNALSLNAIEPSHGTRCGNRYGNLAFRSASRSRRTITRRIGERMPDGSG